ncbi:protein pinocchio isoform X1 [Drosophila albomicans]|uniref:Protein pinocchio isoform X1 n=2 Tax=Drosophila albomicans TaxID=7291 RepID=A0A6P8WS78_DROAB|nr:protein pinocchio isoform X1 [Drosophila albomicans]
MKQRSATSSNNNSFASSSNNNSNVVNININNNSNYAQQQQLKLESTTVTTATTSTQQQQLTKSTQIVTEWEDGIIFDVDDPDFCPGPTTATAVVIDKLTVATATNSCAAALRNLNFIAVPTTATTMSSASVRAPQIADICSPLAHHSLGLSASLPDLVGSPLEINMDNVLTIEELRQHIGSCFTCGVSWTDDHVSLDCSECGGYSLERPCPLCDGQCGVQWKRDFAMSHACRKARWVGVCLSFPEAMAAAVQQLPVAGNGPATSCAAAAAHQLRLAQELCSRLEQLSTTSATATNKITRL